MSEPVTVYRADEAYTDDITLGSGDFVLSMHTHHGLESRLLDDEELMHLIRQASEALHTGERRKRGM